MTDPRKPEVWGIRIGQNAGDGKLLTVRYPMSRTKFRVAVGIFFLALAVAGGLFADLIWWLAHQL